MTVNPAQQNWFIRECFIKHVPVREFLNLPVILVPSPAQHPFGWKFLLSFGKDFYDFFKRICTCQISMQQAFAVTKEMAVGVYESGVYIFPRKVDHFIGRELPGDFPARPDGQYFPVFDRQGFRHGEISVNGIDHPVVEDQVSFLRGHAGIGKYENRQKKGRK